MKYLALSFAMLFFGWSVSASSNNNSAISGLSPFNNYGEAFIFVEGGVEFAIYRNGEFDFYYDPQFSRNSQQLSIPNGNISYNSGYNYDPYVQYDDYGAVIQIENVPVFYDYYGRIIQAGNIFIDYNRYGNISRVGGLRVKYNSFHQPFHYSGYINSYNSRYVYQPWHKYYSRPHSSYRVVYYEPYRAYYEPIRMNYVEYNTFYSSSNYNQKSKNDYYRPGRSNMNVAYNNGRRTSEKRDIASATTRTSENIGRRTNTSSSREVSTNDRGASNKTVLMGRSSTVNNNSAKEISNNERHAAAVRSNTNATGVSTPSSSVIGRSAVSRDNDATVRSNTSSAGRSSENIRMTNVPVKIESVSRGRTQTQTPSRTETVQRSQSNSRSENVRTNTNTSNSRAGRSSSSRDDSSSSVRKR